MENIEEVKPVEETEGDDEVIVPGTGTEGEPTPAPSSGEEKPADESEEEPEKAVADATSEEEVAATETEEPEEEEQPAKAEPRPVEGETPKERALRSEVERVKAKLRAERGTKLLGDVQPQKAVVSAELSDEDKKALEAYDPEQVQNLEKVFGVLAKKHGYVQKDEFTKQNYSTASQEVFEDWMEKHPEYSEENDKDGILWNRFREEFGLYQKPANPKVYTKIFNKIHNEIFGITTQPKGSVGQAQAQQEKIKVASAGGKASVAPKKASEIRKSHSEQELAQVARGGALKGFTDEELDEMGL
jgi:murein L,D-transpeptidase YcbB/YkuD